MTRDQALMPRKRPLQARARRTVEAILEGAAQVFEKHGYAHTTTDRIAERAGVSVGSLYQYFPNKDAVIVALAERHQEAGLSRVREMLSETAAGAIEALDLDVLLGSFVRDLIELHRNHPRLHRLLVVEARMPSDQLERLSRQEDELATEVAVLLRAHPDITVRDPGLSAWLLIHAAEGLIHDFVVHPPPGPVGEECFVEEMVRLLRGYLVAR
jgi:AcrR family transcriptional regulator